MWRACVRDENDDDDDPDDDDDDDDVDEDEDKDAHRHGPGESCSEIEYQYLLGRLVGRYYTHYERKSRYVVSWLDMTDENGTLARSEMIRMAPTRETRERRKAPIQAAPDDETKLT